MKRFFLLILTLLAPQLAFAAKEATVKTDYPGHALVACTAVAPAPDKSAAALKGAELAKAALAKPYDAPDSVWEPKILTNRKSLVTAIREFLDGKRGKSVKDLKLAGKTPEAIHSELLAAGFTHERIPLASSAQDEGKEKGTKRFLKQDGTKTANKKDADIIHMDIYAHTDGGIVRVKAEGVPDAGYPRPQPHASKGVALSLDLRMKPRAKSMGIDTRYRNEAFKVSEDGRPIPKAPGMMTGLRRLHSREELKTAKDADEMRTEERAWVSTIMDAVHFDVSVDRAHCEKAAKKAA